MNRCMGCMAEIEEEQSCCPYCGYQIGTGVKEAYYLLPGKILRQKYIVGKVLGYGGFGVTYIGWDAQLGRKVAIKEYLPSDFATRSYGEQKLTVFSGDATQQFHAGLESFISEAKRLAKFNKIPEIVDIYDCFMENDTGYIIMEYLEGETVKEILAREGKMPFEEARRIMIAVLNGLSCVHREGIIHRDIAPDNIFIHKNGTVKILDFGAARYATTIHSRSLSVILKPGYAPEEQYRSRGNQGPWTDIYAAGASFYRMLTGIRPKESIERFNEDTLQTPSELGISIPKSIENAIMNSLNIKAENRIQNAETFCRVLREQEEMERVLEEQERQKAMQMPLWMKAFAAGAGALALVVIFLLATGSINFTKKEITSKGSAETLSENEAYTPDISGMSYQEAEGILQEMKLKLVINGMNYSETIEKNRILSQDPYGGGIIKQGETIYVVMSGGNQEVMMPDLKGMKKKEALSLIKAQGLKQGDISEEYDDVVEKGRVISQTIKAEERISVNTSVGIVISKGRISEEAVVLAVPDLVGMTNEEAVKALKKMKKKEGHTFSLGEIKQEYSDTVEKGKIISQSLPAGSEARTDEVISLVISKGSEKVTVPNVVYSKEKEAVAAMEAAGLSVKTTTQYSDQVAKGCVISQSEKEGSEVSKGTDVTLVISLGESSSNQSSSSSDDSGYSNPNPESEPEPTPQPEPEPMPQPEPEPTPQPEPEPTPQPEPAPEDDVIVNPTDDVDIVPD